MTSSRDSESLLMLTLGSISLAIISNAYAVKPTISDNDPLVAQFKAAMAYTTRFGQVLSMEPCSNRTVWNALRTSIPVSLKKADAENVTGIKPFNDTTYLIFSQTGSRVEGETMVNGRINSLINRVWAECYMGTGSYMPMIEKDLVDIATQRTWSVPAHDPQLREFDGTAYAVTLDSAITAAAFGQILFLLQDILTINATTTVIRELNRKIFRTLIDSLRGSARAQSFVDVDTNVNAVCWANVMAALHSLPYNTSSVDQQYTLDSMMNLNDKALLTAAAWKYGSSYFQSYADDSYASEGTTYYNYGMGNFIVLRQAMIQATRGTFDMFRVSTRVAQAAMFAIESGMSSTNYQAFTDSPLENTVAPGIVKYFSIAFDLTLPGGNWSIVAPSPYNSMPAQMIGLFTSLIKVAAPSGEWSYAASVENMVGLRKYYNLSGVLIARGKRLDTPATLGNNIDATFKLGGNGGGHSHNDIGSYHIALNSQKLTGDPGGPIIYEARTFDYRRFTSPLINSIGHPVPVVCGKLQVEAEALVQSREWKSKRRILSESFTDDVDTLLYDLAPAYIISIDGNTNIVRNLNGLNRSITFDRSNQVVLIRDTASFQSIGGIAGSFEDAIIANYNYTIISSDTVAMWKVGTQPEAKLYAKVTVKSNLFNCPTCIPNRWSWNVTAISDFKVSFTRIGVAVNDFNNRLSNVQVDMMFWTNGSNVDAFTASQSSQYFDSYIAISAMSVTSSLSTALTSTIAADCSSATDAAGVTDTGNAFHIESLATMACDTTDTPISELNSAETWSTVTTTTQTSELPYTVAEESNIGVVIASSAAGGSIVMIGIAAVFLFRRRIKKRFGNAQSSSESQLAVTGSNGSFSPFSSDAALNTS
jgi:hypothetical protein